MSTTDRESARAVPVFDQRSNVAYCRIARSGDVLAFYIFYKSPEQIIHVDIHGRIQNVSLGGRGQNKT